jgi:hypothetical protein
MAFAMLVIFGHNFFTVPSLGYRAEPWAETVTNYLHHALQDGFFEALTRTDAGYLVLFPRFLAHCITRLDFGVLHFPFIAQLVSHIAIAGFSAIMISAKLNPFITSRPSRLLLALLVGLYPDYELRAFINFAYFAFPLLALAAFWDLRMFIGWTVWVAIPVVAMLAASKGLFIVFLPVFLLRILWDIWAKRGWRNLMFSSAIVLALLWQLKVMACSAAQRPDAMPFSLTKFLLEWVPYVFHLFSSLFLRRPPKFLGFLLSLGVLAWSLFGLRRMFVREENKWERLAFALLLLYLSGGMLFINYLASLREEVILKVSIRFFEVGAPVMGRQYFGINLSVMILLLLSAQYYGRQFKLVLPFLVIMLMLRCGYFRFFEIEIYPQREDSFSDWVIFRQEIFRQDYFIPVNPYPWYLAKNVDVRILKPEQSKPGRFAIADSARLRTLVLTFEKSCGKIQFLNSDGSEIAVEEIGSADATRERKHRIFDFSSVQPKGNIITFYCGETAETRRAEIIQVSVPSKSGL